MSLDQTGALVRAHDSSQSTRPAIQAEALARAVAESMSGGVLVVDAAGVIALANHQIESLFGYSCAELVGQSIDILLPASSRAAHAAHRASVIATPDAHPMGAGRELLFRRRDGSEFPAEVGLSPLATDDGTFVLAVVIENATPQIEATGRSVAEGQLEFERLVAELSASFINLPADRVDDAMRDALRRIGEALDLDRCTFFRIQPDGVAVAPVAWHSRGIPPPPAPLSIKERCPWVYETILAGKLIRFASVDEIPNPIDRATYRSVGILSAVTVPLSVAGRLVGAVGFNAIRQERSWSPEVVHRLRVFASAFGSVLARRESDEALQRALEEVGRLRDQLHAENVYLRTEALERRGPSNIVGKSSAVRQVLEQIQLVSATDSTVLLLGETGTGKELFATRIHELSSRHARTIVRVNCAAIPATLLESELFGREKGAFTGALSRQVGRFELADHSTIFLDEIGDLPVDVQVKLLRVLEEHQIERLGNPKPIRVDTRIIAATHRNLEQRISEGTFREDLFYRLNVFPIQVPPLRERAEDIPLLVQRFVEEFSKTFAKRIDTIDKDNLAALQHYSWPGNIRELRNVVERAMITATSRRLTIPVPQSSASSAKRSPKLADVEKEHIRAVLETTGWRIRGAGGAAERLGLPPTTLETRLAKLGLRRPKES
jgi:formate hydrogenlyase transcriptional activator